MRLSSMNLNQLVALDALLDARNVGQAARRMGVTQSAMSHTLRSLRELLDDPILVRVGNTMELTPFAEQIHDKLRRGLGELEGIVSGRTAFDPSKITDTFTVATLDPVAAIIAAPLNGEFSSRAPQASLRIRPLRFGDVEAQLSSGEADVAVVPPFAIGDSLRTETLDGAPSVVVVARRDHPGIGKRLTLAKYCKATHAMLSLTGDGPSMIDAIVEQKGRRREVRVRVPYVLALAEIVSTSDHLATVLEGLGEFLCELWPLELHPFPLPTPDQTLLLAWHPRHDAEPSHAFFRDVLRTSLYASIHRGNPGLYHSASRRR